MAASETTTKKSTARNMVGNVRVRLAQVVGVAFTLIAVFLLLAAILVAVRHNINADNPLVQLVLNIADTFDGPFSRKNGIVQFDGKHAVTQEALANWGIAAAVYLAVGRILSKIIRP